MIQIPDTLAACAVDVLTTADAMEKTAKSRLYAKAWFEGRAAGQPMPIGSAEPPARPARPERPELLAPRDVPRRRPGTPAGRKALLHAVAHIELNAVDLHWDIIARFTATPMPLGFYDDWVKSADEEAKHFRLISDCLATLGSYYGELPAHAGMWRAAEDTATDLMGRLTVVPMVLEARGLDVTPGMIEIFRKADQPDAIASLETIYAEEVGHVAYGSKWFHFLCGRHEMDPKETFHALVRKYFHGALKPPFNEEKRAEAGIPPDFYWPLAEQAE
ncbi:ferritin-like domain-containing protein [Sedimentimonas flavescens]|uniref:Ferritin-like domain-containing protein n=1 Tax=Sedimentimonas flavescens TaxID=2851012 RepID=A0ABT2ZX27_9RHOB|nr:ferritin-like domain-containing protein [Sedimentimonas flavescens]MCT2538324.1 ferritin-like domain-containing protein [Sedimentimonas flavescens]MCV2878292.1 ferritin-like domain-containing protein [Sedimentimonas flavescens]